MHIKIDFLLQIYVFLVLTTYFIVYFEANEPLMKKVFHRLCFRNKTYVTHGMGIAVIVKMFLTSSSARAHSHNPISRFRFLVPKIGNRRSDGPSSRFRFCNCGENVGR